MILGILFSYLLIGAFSLRRLISNSEVTILPSQILFFIMFTSGLVNFILFICSDLILDSFSSNISSRHNSLFLISELDQSLFFQVHLFFIIFLSVLSLLFFREAYIKKINLNLLEVIENNFDKHVQKKLLFTLVIFLILSPIKIKMHIFYDAALLILVSLIIFWVSQVEHLRNLIMRMFVSIFSMSILLILVPYLMNYSENQLSLNIERGAFINSIIVLFTFSYFYMSLLTRRVLIIMTLFFLFILISVFLLDVLQELTTFSQYLLLEKFIKFNYVFEHTIFRNAAVVLDSLKNSNMYLNGHSYVTALYGLIPFTGIERGLSNHVIEAYENLLLRKINGGMASGLIVEGIINFGVYFGAVFTSFVISIILYLVDYIFSIHKKTILHYLFAVYCISILYSIFRYDIAIVLRKIEYGLLLIIIINLAFFLVGKIQVRLNKNKNDKF